MSSVATAQPTGRKPRGAKGNWWVGWLFIVPTLIFFVGWQLYPIYRVAYLSFTDYNFLDPAGTPVHWIGFQNFREALADPLMRKGLLRALGFTALFLPGMIFIPMFIAVLIDRVQNPKAATFYRLILLIPSMIPGPLIFLLWRWMYDLYVGPINYFLVDVFHFYDVYTQPQWIGNPKLVFPAITAMEWWWGLGYHTMFFLAGLATIPKDFFDAARVDGANEWRMFWDVTFPRLLPIILVLVVLRFGTAMAVIDEYLIMGGFNRERPTYTWTVYMYETAFQRPPRDLGFASAVGWIGTIGMLVIVAILFRIFRSRD